MVRCARVRGPVSAYGHVEVRRPARAALEGRVGVVEHARHEGGLGATAEEEHAVLLRRVHHVVELARRPRRVEVGDGGEGVDVHRGRVHEHVQLGVRFGRVLEEVVARDHHLAVARAQPVEQRLALARHPQPLLADEEVEVVLGHHLILSRLARLEQARERGAQLGADSPH